MLAALSPLQILCCSPSGRPKAISPFILCKSASVAIFAAALPIRNVAGIPVEVWIMRDEGAESGNRCPSCAPFPFRRYEGMRVKERNSRLTVVPLSITSLQRQGTHGGRLRDHRTFMLEGIRGVIGWRRFMRAIHRIYWLYL